MGISYNAYFFLDVVYIDTSAPQCLRNQINYKHETISRNVSFHEQQPKLFLAILASVIICNCFLPVSSFILRTKCQHVCQRKTSVEFDIMYRFTFYLLVFYNVLHVFS